jgi:hypothetical protein
MTPDNAASTHDVVDRRWPRQAASHQGT